MDNEREVIKKGSLTGVTLAGGVKANIDFNRAKGVAKLKLKAAKNTPVLVNLPDGTVKVKGVAPTDINEEKTQLNITLAGGKTTLLTVKWQNKI